MNQQPDEEPTLVAYIDPVCVECGDDLGAHAICTDCLVNLSPEDPTEVIPPLAR